MGFSRSEEGLELNDEQLVNFLLLCHQTMILPEEEEEIEEDENHGDMKVKVIKMDSGNMHEMMNDILGHGSPKVDM
jgi:hypothetical protein